MNTTKLVFAFVLVAALMTSAQPLAAEVEDCYENVLGWCAEAMDGARWYEKFAIGELCVGLLAGCTGANLIK